MKNLNYSLIVVLCLLSSVSLFSQNTRIPERQIDVESELVRFRNFFDRLSEEEITQKGSGYKPFKRWEWFISKRTDTGGTIPFGARWNVFQDILENRANSPQLALDADWQSLGPVTGTVYSAGRMLDIALDPNNPDIIWAGAASGGIWRSPDAGASWTPMDDYLPTLAVGCVLTHNTDSNIIYIGTGEGNFNADAVFGVGVLKSIDGGTTWNTTGLSWNMADHAAVNEMVMHPQNPDIIIATTRNGVYRTADAGGSWTQTLSFSSDEEDAKDIALDPDNPDNVFVSLGYMWGANSNGIYKSTDNGLTWTRLSTGLPAASTNIGRIAIAMHAANPLVLYAAYTGSYYHNGSALLGVYKTVDGGANWTQQSTSPNFYNKQGWYNNIIAAHPTDPATVYVGGVYLYKSTNSGVDWASISSSIHVDQHAIQFHPENPEIVYVGNDGGMYKTLNGGSSWITLNDGLTTMQFYAMGTDPNDGAVAFGGTQDNGTNRITSPTWTHVLGADGGECIVDYSNSDVVYAEYQLGNHFRSTDGGDSWKQINSGLVGDGPWVTPVEMDPVDPYTLYTISNHNLYKTTNQGTNWTLLYDAPEDMDTCIRVAHSDNQTIYASGSRVIYRTTDGGSSWTDVTPSEYISNISSIAVHPTQSQVLYICSSTWNATMRIAKSTDGGTSWTNITHNLSELPCNSIVIDPVYPNHIYVGTDIGVYLSTDAGASWNEWSTGLPNVHIDELEIHATWRFIYAATHGRGMYVSPLYEPGDLVTQEISFISGWNWFSVNVENDNMNPNTVLSSIERLLYMK